MILDLGPTVAQLEELGKIYEQAEESIYSSELTVAQQVDALGITQAQFVELGVIVAAYQQLIAQALREEMPMIQALSAPGLLYGELLHDFVTRHSMDMNVFRKGMVLANLTVTLSPLVPVEAPARNPFEAAPDSELTAEPPAKPKRRRAKKTAETD